MKQSEACMDILRHIEQCVLRAYKDAVGVWTIGWGTTRYKDGTPVKQGDVVTQAVADDLLYYEANAKASFVSKLFFKTTLTQNQFDACVSLAYNIGTGAFERSTLLQKILKNPCDPYIDTCFLMWNKGTVAGKKVVLKGLTSRRRTESHLYFTGEIVYYKEV